MVTERQVTELRNLIRLRYPDWQDFAHPPFVADELDYKRATIAKAADLISQPELDRLMEEAAYDEITKQRRGFQNYPRRCLYQSFSI